MRREGERVMPLELLFDLAIAAVGVGLLATASLFDGLTPARRTDVRVGNTALP